MAKQYANIQPGFDTFAAWVTKTNNLLDDMTNIVVTVASNSVGAVTTGNAHITGTLSGTTGTFNTIRGGNVSTNATLSIASNVAIANGYTLSFGNSTVNTTVTAASLTTGNSIINTTAVSTTALIGVTVFVGNSTVNTTVNATSFSGIANNANNLGGASLATLQSQITGNAATAYTNAVSSIGALYLPLAGGTLSGTVNVGSIVSLSTLSLNIGNSTVNTTVNATSFSGIANSANALTTSRNIALTTDATGNGNFNGTANLTIAVTLANSGVTANTYGNTTVYPVITVDAKGRVTAVTAQTVSVPAAGVTSFNTRTGAVTLTAADITGNSSVGLNYTPVSANTSGTITGSLTLTSGDLTLRDVISSRDIRVGNSTVNTVVNAVSISIGNSTIDSTTVTIGNTTVNSVVNSTSVTTGNSTVNSTFSAANTVLYTPTIRGSRETVLANTTAAGAMTLDLSYGIHRWTVTGNITSLNYTNVPANNTVFSGILHVTANATGTNATNRAITFPSTANATTGKTLWSGATVPPQTSSNSAVDIYSFFTIDGGNNYVWSLVVKDAR